MQIQRLVLLFQTNDQVVIDKDIITCCNFYGVTNTLIYVNGDLKCSQACTNFVISFEPKTKHIHYGKGHTSTSYTQDYKKASGEGLTRVAFGKDLMYVLVEYTDGFEQLIQVPNEQDGGYLDININTDNVYIHGSILQEEEA